MDRDAGPYQYALGLWTVAMLVFWPLGLLGTIAAWFVGALLITWALADV